MSDRKEINTAFVEQIVALIKRNNSKELNGIISDLHMSYTLCTAEQLLH